MRQLFIAPNSTKLPLGTTWEMVNACCVWFHRNRTRHPFGPSRIISV